MLFSVFSCFFPKSSCEQLRVISPNFCNIYFAAATTSGYFKSKTKFLPKQSSSTSSTFYPKNIDPRILKLTKPRRH